MTPNCIEIKCNDCCKTGYPNSGPFISQDEIDLRGFSHVEMIIDGLERYVASSKQTLGCMYIVERGCGIWSDKPTICNTYPFMLNKNELVVSLNCKWVRERLIRSLSVGLSEEEHESLKRIKRDLQDSPVGIIDYWDKLLASYESVLTIKV